MGKNRHFEPTERALEGNPIAALSLAQAPLRFE